MAMTMEEGRGYGAGGGGGGGGGCMRSMISQGIQRCPFLRSIVEPTSFTFFPSANGDGYGCSSGERPPARRGPIFEDGPAFAMAFELFHGELGPVPLSRRSTSPSPCFLMEAAPSMTAYSSAPAGRVGDGEGRGGGGEGEGVEVHHNWNPLASAGVASISMAGFGGPSGRFGWEGFMGSKSRRVASEEAKGDGGAGGGADGHLDVRGKHGISGGGAASAAAAAGASASAAAAIATSAAASSSTSSSSSSSSSHEASGSEWLQSRCPIAKMHRSLVDFVPLMAAKMKPPANMKLCCPAPIVAARAALARTSAVRSLRPKPVSNKIVAVGVLCLAVNVPLGVWREHVVKFSPQWFLAVHASIPFIAMFRKALLMPKYAIAFTIATAVIGQTIGSRAERIRLATVGLRPGTLGECVSNYAATSATSASLGEEGGGADDGNRKMGERGDVDSKGAARKAGKKMRAKMSSAPMIGIGGGSNAKAKEGGKCSPAPRGSEQPPGGNVVSGYPTPLPLVAMASAWSDDGGGAGGATPLPLSRGFEPLDQMQGDGPRGSPTGMPGNFVPLAAHVRRAVVAAC
ncbi:hypothetical protein CBR_g1048 [Chara braunii]|uniref:Uncharacterized protein n=1 Tax=Chara braunii TaxID=69332 RepID=A0A388KD11_CHABU|nr:hypothetical protein CBR_g1048 [Chara braunii]|eukprot:GBG67929.1 hypothetical protein CBR_g1048 [Chara braunii]